MSHEGWGWAMLAAIAVLTAVILVDGEVGRWRCDAGVALDVRGR